ncbi:MAG: hypothetical protein RLZZ241_671 [Bacteroidota bacterium]|jgi:hypothetical protein
MSSQLHITNGDAFTQLLQSQNLKGEIITWREMLCEGKTETNVGSEVFWRTRFDFLHKTYNVSKSWFIEKTLKEYRSLCNHKQQDEIVLWFEYDLFCQINMLAVISWLKTYRRHARITLACSGDQQKKGVFKTLNQLSPSEIHDLYTNRFELSQDDIEYADYIWQLYCSDNPIRLEHLSDFQNYNFKYLENAIKVHLKRFPTIKNGLNAIENKVLQIADSEKLVSKSELIGSVLGKQGWYGFGDSQYDRMLQSLNPLFKSFNPVRLSLKGIAILENKTSYYQEIRNNETYLGGALKYNFLFNSDTERILKL